jgi:hypothetical protein
MAKVSSDRTSRWSSLALRHLLDDLFKLASTPANSNRTFKARRNAWSYSGAARTLGRSCSTVAKARGYRH